MKKEIKLKIPQIKKTINAFLVGEEGKISKQSIIKAGVILSAVSLGTVKGVIGIQDHNSHASATPHENSMGNLEISGGIASIHHGNHASHGSHGVHSSHSSAPPPQQPPSHYENGDDGGMMGM